MQVATRISLSKYCTFPSRIPHRRKDTQQKIYNVFLSNTTKSNDNHVDIAIVGGGAVGSLMARLLAEEVPSLKVSVLDFRTPRSGKDVLNNESKNIQPNARAYALSPTSLGLLGNDVLNRLHSSGKIALYDSMQIWESDGPATLHFTKEDLSTIEKEQLSSTSSSAIENNILGAVIEDEPLVSCIWDELREKFNHNVNLISPASVKQIVSPSSLILSSQQKPAQCDPIQLTYQMNDSKEDYTLSADLLIAADGGNSMVRRMLGTFPTISIGYGRKAVTCTVVLDSTIDKVAFQRFQPNGPIALLPVWDETADKHYANIVWSTTPVEAKELEMLTDAEFINRMNELLQSGPTNTPPLFSDEIKRASPWPFSQAAQGLEMLSRSVNAGLSMSSWTERRRGFVVPPLITEVIGKRFGFDLNLMHAKNYVGTRVCLIGDGESSNCICIHLSYLCSIHPFLIAIIKLWHWFLQIRVVQLHIQYIRWQVKD